MTLMLVEKERRRHAVAISGLKRVKVKKAKGKNDQKRRRKEDAHGIQLRNQKGPDELPCAILSIAALE